MPLSMYISIPSAAPSPLLVSRPFSSDSGFHTTNSELGLGFEDAVRGGNLVSRQEFERVKEGLDTTNSELGLGFGDAMMGRNLVLRQEIEGDYEPEGVIGRKKKSHRGYRSAHKYHERTKNWVASGGYQHTIQKKLQSRCKDSKE